MVNDPRYIVADPRYTSSVLHILPSHTFEYRAREHRKKRTWAICALDVDRLEYGFCASRRRECIFHPLTIYPFSWIKMYFSFMHRTNDLTKKLEKVGPFECDELEKHCRGSAKCYPTKVPALYTMTKEKFKSVFLLLLLVSRQTKSQLLMIRNLFR